MRKVSNSLLGCWAASFLLVAFGACSSDDPPPLVGISDACLINTDCNSPLVCAFRKCHVACETSRDCGIGQRCMASDRPFHVCQLADEKSCTYNSECPTGQVCGVDQQCRDQCADDRDCVREQLCFASTCVERARNRRWRSPGARRLGCRRGLEGATLQLHVAMPYAARVPGTILRPRVPHRRRLHLGIRLRRQPMRERIRARSSGPRGARSPPKGENSSSTCHRGRSVRRFRW